MLSILAGLPFTARSPCDNRISDVPLFATIVVSWETHVEVLEEKHLFSTYCKPFI